MSITRVLKAVGLWRSPSYMSAPVGAFDVADNCVLANPDVIESRRGFSWLTYTFGTSTDHANQLFSFRGVVLAQYASALAYDSGIAFVDLAGTNAPPDPTVLRMQGLELLNNFYFTSTEGVKVLDEPNSSGVVQLAGVPPGPPIDNRLVPTAKTGNPNTGWMPVDTQVAYVGTWVRTDGNGTEHESTPSLPTYVANPQDLTVGVGELVRVGATVTFTPAITGAVDMGFGYVFGDTAQLTLSPADANFPDGVKTIIFAQVDSSGQLIIKWTEAGAAAANANAGTLSSGTKNVHTQTDIPSNIDDTYTLRIYRTRNSVSNIVPPRQQYYLAIEHRLSAADIAATSVGILDNVPESLLQDPLYTNTDDGEPPDSSPQNDDSRPPYCTDLALFDQRQWGANFSEVQNFTLALLATDAPNGLQIGDTVIVGGIIYTGISSIAVPAVNEFRVFLPGDLGLYFNTPSERVALTARSLALSINQHPASPVIAAYTSGVEDIPGHILITGKNPSTPQFTVDASRPTAFNPDLTGGGLTSSADSETNGLWYSKQNQPEAVCLLNRLKVGPKNARILRIAGLRDRLFVFTDIAGVWVITNTYPNYQITSLSKTAVLYGPDTLASFNDALYCLTSQGVAKFDESGPTILSIPIETDIKAMYGLGLSTLKRVAIGCGYESARRYLLSMPTDPSDTTNNQVFVYDAVSKAWSRWTKAMNAMVVVPQNDFLYTAAPDNNKVSKERKNFDRTDYSDEDYPVNITAATGTSVTLTSAADVEVGDLLYQGPIARSLVAAVNTTTNVVTTKDSITWALGAATIFPGIQIKIFYTPMFSGMPENIKHYREVTYHFKSPAFVYGLALFKGDLNPAEFEVPFSAGGFGDRSWELFAFEQPAVAKNRRAYVATDPQRSAYLSVGFKLREAQSVWQLMGYTPSWENMSERNSAITDG